MSKYNSSTPFSRELGTLVDNFFNNNICNFVGRDFSNGQVAANIIESESEYKIDLAAPGLEKTDFNIKIEKNRLTISANKKVASDTEGTSYKRREFNYTNFQRSFALPENIDKNRIKAAYKNGILMIRIPRITIDKEEGGTTIDIS